ncbi:DUF7009 family protein [Sphingobacterium sp.]|uniref:DUF7009 family protein n=1 Tax=Sphingobacterium sp. TaxID=341027 RepID=UPI002897784A|nr:hypothetical protein [Sphingobacterium sp.]
MKLRIKDNSVRYRLTQSEVAELAKNGAVSSETAFIGRPLIYRIEKIDGQELTADFVENSVVLGIPQRMIEELVATETVGFDGQVGQVKLLVEKDFVCIDNTVEDQSDNYPNPSLTC